jgi:4a-hydroxytetrahydrobiopterin dehydratase
MPPLSTMQINRRLKDVPHWTKRGKTIRRIFSCGGFPKSIDFVDQVADCSQQLDHHPDIDIRFDRVTLTLTSHDAGGLTNSDFTLALRCDEMFSALPGR